MRSLDGRDGWGQVERERARRRGVYKRLVGAGQKTS